MAVMTQEMRAALIEELRQSAAANEAEIDSIVPGHWVVIWRDHAVREGKDGSVGMWGERVYHAARWQAELIAEMLVESILAGEFDDPAAEAATVRAMSAPDGLAVVKQANARMLGGLNKEKA